MRVVYVFHGRFPDPRAAALFAALEASSLAPYAEVEIVVPRRRATDSERAREVHHIPDNVAISILPALDVFTVPFVREFAFQLSMLTFARSLRQYLKGRERSLVMVVDPLFASVAKEAGHASLLEVHDFPKKGNPLWTRGLRDATYVLATNIWKAEALKNEWQVSEKQLITERNGVSIERFATDLSKAEARHQLPEFKDAGRLAVYTGNLYDWKGADTFIAAALALPDVTFAVVGGTQEETERLVKTAPPNLIPVARVPHERVPLYQAAADVLILPNTGKMEISTHYTSPMKLFEYMAAGRPIVATKLPSIEEIIGEDATLVAPDDPEALARGIERVLLGGPDIEAKVTLAREAVNAFSWDARAKRLLAQLAI